MNEEIEEGPAPILTSKLEEIDTVSGSYYFCFKIEEKIYNHGTFQIDSPYINSLSHETKRLGDFVILRVFFGFFSKFLPQRTFTIIFKKGNEILFSSIDFVLKKDETLIEYNITEKYNMKSKEFKSPSSIEQYEAFIKVFKDKDLIYYKTKNYFYENFDIELYLHLLETKQNKTIELCELLNNFPNSRMKVKYNKNKALQKFNFETIQNNKNYVKLALIYSVIQDSTELLNEHKENDLIILFKYNEFHKDSPLIIKGNVLNFFLSKTLNIDNIKRIFQFCESIPLLFNSLIAFGPDKLEKINNLTINDLPNYSYAKDNLIELIENYEKIKSLFKVNEINKLWSNYLYYIYNTKNINYLEKIKQKFIEINEPTYKTIIEEMTIERIKKGKRMIIDKMLSNLDMFRFINKYNSLDNFYSDQKLLISIGENINLKDFENEENLKEFNQCKFLNKINIENIQYYIK